MIKSPCPIAQMFYQISKQWTLHILHSIYKGEETFSGLKKSLPGISSRTLSSRLKELQNLGFIHRNIISETPIKIRYSLSEKGQSFSLQMESLGKWAIEWEGK